MEGRAARERLERARREWLVAYRERERVVLEELARTEDSHIEEAIHGMRLPLQRPFVDPPATPSLSRSRSRERRGEARRRRRRAGADAPRRPPRVRRANSPGADLPAPGAAHSWDRVPGPRALATTAKSGSPARPRSPGSPSPPLRRAPPDLARHWREQMAQRPPGSFDVINDLSGDDDEQTPAAPAGAECPLGDLLSEYPEDWGPMDDWVAAGGGCGGPAPGAALAGGDRVPTTPRGRTPQRFQESHPAASGSRDPAGPAPGAQRRDRNPLAPVHRDGSRSQYRGRTHFPRRDPRHTGPRLLHAGGIEICRGYNRGSCGGPGGADCRHGRAHACNQCGRPHPATDCATPEAEWPEKEGAVV